MTYLIIKLFKILKYFRPDGYENNTPYWLLPPDDIKIFSFNEWRKKDWKYWKIRNKNK